MSENGPGGDDPRAPSSGVPTGGEPQRGPATHTEGETLDLPEGMGGFSKGQVLGDRYQILEMLGRGGMGEVWHALDLKLRVEVALKALRPEFFKSERRLELLRQEVRAAREVVSPNVCRIFDLVEVEGRELVSMEYVDGATLLGVLQERGPLELKEAQDIASQFLAGLEAIHKVGLVHRDIKPENIMLTRAGRVVVMDFGLARQETEGGGTVAGTPAYMAPEQAAGQPLDARADVYAAGVVLAEMVCPEGIKSIQSRQSVWKGVRSEPAKVPDTPWAVVIKKAVAKDREGRYHSAHTLTRALEDVTLRVEGAEDLHPYPGLASFTEADAEYFFGREAEVEQMWRRLDRPHLLAVAGPSGSGKTSFLRAGLTSGTPPGWRIRRCTPGNTPFTALRELLAAELSGDADAMRLLVKGDDTDALVEAFSAWRQRHSQAILIVDQFEELFTLNPHERQKAFAELMRRLVLEADVFVLLSLRDDFLARCREHEAFESVFSDLTVLLAPAGAALRRALTQPALQCGYRFEDDELVEEMLAEVEGERGALPLLAFAAARLWDRRDRETGLLTRQAYQDIGGVGGALAQHAEASIDRIGLDRIPIFRELFRNLVTAEGTRAVRESDELLSVFETTQRDAAEEVLQELTDARLLTSYEVREEDEGRTTRVEIIHESLLANWPRLVRWQTQDADAAQLRDQLRQAAKTWDEHGRTGDTLWTGAAYREYASWRERYAGGLTDLEEAFGSAMTHYADRRRRRRRAAVAAIFVILLGVLTIIGGFWQRSVSEARRAEAANLLSLGRLALEKHPSATIAYAIASLEQADSPEVRRLAVEALWIGPTELRIGTPAFYMTSLEFSADGRWLATADPQSGSGKLWPSDGGPPTVLEGGKLAGSVRISPLGDLVAANMSGMRELGLWSSPEGCFLRSFSLGDRSETWVFQFSPDGNSLMAITYIQNEERYEHVFRTWPVAGGEPTLVARVEVPEESFHANVELDPSWSRIAWADGRRARIARIEGGTADLASATSVEHDRIITFVGFDLDGQQLATVDQDGAIRIWSLETDPPRLIRAPSGGWAGEAEKLIFDTSGSILAATGGQLWDLTAPPETELLQLRDPEWLIYGLAFHPNGKWHATSVGYEVALWPLARSYPRVLRVEEGGVGRLAFTSDGEHLVSKAGDGSIRVWPLNARSGERSRVIHRTEGIDTGASRLEVAPNGSFIAMGTRLGLVGILPLDGGAIRELGSFERPVMALAVGPRSRLVAAGSRGDQAFVRVWDFESGKVRTLYPGDVKKIVGLDFTSDSDLRVATDLGLQRWRLEGDEPQILESLDLSISELVPNGSVLDDIDLESRQAAFVGDTLSIVDIDRRVVRELGSHGVVQRARLFAGGKSVVSGDRTGEVRVGPVTGDEPHLLLGHEMEVNAMAVSPDGRWIATGGDDKTIRLWPMPDLSKPPLHALPRLELIAKLRTLTNLRAVRDQESPTGWKIETGPFPGWETVPTW